MAAHKEQISFQEGRAGFGGPAPLLLAWSVGRLGVGASFKPLDDLMQPPDRRAVSVAAEFEKLRRLSTRTQPEPVCAAVGNSKCLKSTPVDHFLSSHRLAPLGWSRRDGC